MNAPAVVAMENIVFRRGAVTILDGITWRFQEGAHWALLGANGSGKTTLLKILTGYEWPTQGRVHVLGADYGAVDLRTLRKIIGWVSNALAPRIPPGDTAKQVVLSGLDATFGLYRTPSAGEEARAEAALGQAGAAPLRDRPFRWLSQGETQRVFIARALVAQPRLLVLDEPCAGLDPIAREDFLADIAQLATGEGSPAVILVTHHVEEIGPWITGVHLLRNGKTVAQGPPETTLTTTTLTQTFNRPVTLKQKAGRYTLQTS